MLIRNPCDCDVYFKVEVYSSGPDQVNTPDSSADKEDEVEKIVAKKDKIANAWGGIESPRKAAADELRENRVALVNSLKESEIEVIEVAGMLPARSQQAIHLRACLKEAVEKRFKIYYTLECKLKIV